MVVIPRRRAAMYNEAGVNLLGMLGVVSVAIEKKIEDWVRLALNKSLMQLGVARQDSIWELR
ncbi:hypothetical protein V8C35DRAFT_318624 [Trichoderma chlorosporum]